jgi:hypothetical protein
MQGHPFVTLSKHRNPSLLLFPEYRRLLLLDSQKEVPWKAGDINQQLVISRE